MNFNHVFPSQGAATLSGLYSLSLFWGRKDEFHESPFSQIRDSWNSSFRAWCGSALAPSYIATKPPTVPKHHESGSAAQMTIAPWRLISVHFAPVSKWQWYSAPLSVRTMLHLRTLALRRLRRSATAI